MPPPRRDASPLPWFALMLFGLMPGCYLSHGLETPPDAAPRTDVAMGGCVSDADCADGDRCTTDRCVGGRCTHDPISFSRHTAYPGSTGPPIDVTSDGARALVLTASLGAEPFDASGPAGTPTFVMPTGDDRDWDSAITTDGTDTLVVTVTNTSVVLQSLMTGMRDMRPVAGYFVTAEWTGTEFVSIEYNFESTCTLRVLDPVLGFVGDPMTVTCPSTPVPPAMGLPPWTRSVRGANGEVRLLGFLRERELVEWTPSRGAQPLTLATPPGIAFHSFTSREAYGVLGAAWVRIDEGSSTLVAAVVQQESDTLVPILTPIERATPELGTTYAYWMSAAACSHRFVLVAADASGLHVLELDRNGEALSEWRSIGPFGQVGGISSACIDGGVVVAEWDAVHVLTCEE